jgi:hypothetical protein
MQSVLGYSHRDLLKTAFCRFKDFPFALYETGATSTLNKQQAPILIFDTQQNVQLAFSK